MNSPRVAVLVPATQRYTVFVPPILESFDKYFLKDCAVEVIILTDLPEKVGSRSLFYPAPSLAGRHDPQVSLPLPVRGRSWQRSTTSLCATRTCAWSRRCGREILGDLVATRHPYFYDRQPADYIYERNPSSTAYIAPGAGSAYVMGAFFGGRYANMLEMAADRSAAIRR